jgi:hypothetical protein
MNDPNHAELLALNGVMAYCGQTNSSLLL